MENHIILGIHITDRTKKAASIQEVLTKYGCSIKTRLGLHEASATVCSPAGIILLELVEGCKETDTIKNELSSIEGIEIQSMIFEH